MSMTWKAAILTPGAILTAVAVAYGAVSSQDEAGHPPHGAREGTAVVERFADAPHGVDPIVTGPAPKAFRERQKALDCDDARWPHVAAACFPDMKRAN